MELTGYQSRESLRQWAEGVVRFLTENKEDAIAAELTAILSENRTDSFLIAVIAKAKRGKSTLINALLGRHDDVVAPIARMPTSSAITRFTWGDHEQATIRFRGGQSPVPIPFSQIREFVTEEENPGNVKNVSLLDVAGPFQGLEKDLILVDTPGAGSIHEHHDAILHGFIPQADAVLFLITAEMPLDQDELNILQRIKNSDIRKVFFAINQVDKADAKEIAEGIAHNQLLLTQCGIPVGSMHQISADRAYKGDVSASGLLSLVQEMAAFLAEHKGRVLRERFISRIHGSVQPILEALDIRISEIRRRARLPFNSAS